jgi:hypothetical protein
MPQIKIGENEVKKPQKRYFKNEQESIKSTSGTKATPVIEK